jgi:hypothetical protein
MDNNNDALGNIHRSIELLLKVNVHEMKGDRGQSEMIVLLDSLGFKSGEIIRVLGASEGTVRPILSRLKKKKKSKVKR